MHLTSIYDLSPTASEDGRGWERPVSHCSSPHPYIYIYIYIYMYTVYILYIYCIYPPNNLHPLSTGRLELSILSPPCLSVRTMK